MARSIKHYDNDGATQLPASKTLEAILAGATGTARKFGVKNSGTVALEAFFAEILQVGLNTGYAQIRIGKDTRTLSPPWLVTAVLVSPGASGAFTLGSKGYVLTSVSASGETVASDEAAVTVTAATNHVQLAWSRDPNPLTTAQRLYRTNTPGTYPASSLIATLAPSVEDYLDLGAAAASGSPPAENTSDGGSPSYGTAPALGVADILFGDVEQGQWAFWWANRVVPVGADDEENPFLSYVQFEEA